MSSPDDREYTMSLFDTIRCLYHDPGYLWEIHGDAIVGGSAVLALMFVMWGL